ncbi:MAG: twitching motility protein [Desulfobulbus sp.]|nr:twitching motility protein [Desulfobulbus sp.]
MELNNNQAAVILTASEDGEITIDVESPDMNGLASALCHALAKKLMRDEGLQAELMEMLEGESEGKED